MINVEFKAELRDPELARGALRAAGAVRAHGFEQTDTYFRIPDARLKKRETPGEPTEWIFYDREDRPLPKLSRFTIYDEEQALARFGSRPLPVWVTVRKHRELWLLGSVRVHLDEVERLGRFLEIEALVSPKQNVAACHKAIAVLRRGLGPALGEPISCGYADLLAAEETPHLS
jgi:adenylate cyclase class IV